MYRIFVISAQPAEQLASLCLSPPSSPNSNMQNAMGLEATGDDGSDPLWYLMNDELEGIIVSDGLARPSASASELLNVLPQQSHSVKDGMLRLSFDHEWKDVSNPLEISLVVDASPGCGGLAWPAGQVRTLYALLRFPMANHCRF